MRGIGLALPSPAIGLWFLVLWQIFLVHGTISHFNEPPPVRPEDQPRIYEVAPWGPLTIQNPTGPQSALCRKVAWPQTFFTLRYLCWSTDGGATSQGEEIGTDVRWGPVAIAFAVSAALLGALTSAARLNLFRFAGRPPAFG